MNDTKIASKAKAQLAHFMGKVFTHFSKPSKKFIEECIYGIQASGDTKLSSIVRAIGDDIRPIYTEKRLSRNLDDETLEASVAEAVLKDGARSVRGDTLLLVDPTVIRKEFSYKMEFVTRVRDASRSSKEGRDVLVNGYHGCMVAACRPGGRKTVPLALKLWSSRSPGFKGENDEVLKIVKAVYAATGGKGMFKSQWRVVEGYLSRWRIEETIRFVKQSYGFENIRVMTYARIRNMASLVLASAYFATVWIGRNIKREVLAEHLAHLGKRLGEVPEFAAYAIADGIKRAFTRFGKWVRTAADAIAKAHDAPTIQLLPGFAELFDTDDG